MICPSPSSLTTSWSVPPCLLVGGSWAVKVHQPTSAESVLHWKGRVGCVSTENQRMLFKEPALTKIWGCFRCWETEESWRGCLASLRSFGKHGSRTISKEGWPLAERPNSKVGLFRIPTKQRRTLLSAKQPRSGSECVLWIDPTG